MFKKDLQYYKFCLYGFLKNLRFFEAFLYLFFLEKGLSFLQIGSLVAIREITRTISEIPSGFLADLLGRRRLMIFAFVLYISSFIVFYLAGSFVLFAGAMFVYGLADASRTGTHKAMIYEYLLQNGWGDQKVGYYGNTRSWSQAGSALSSLLAAALVIYSGSYKYIFLFSAIPYTLDLLLMISYPKSLEGKGADVSKANIWGYISELWNELLRMLKSGKNILRLTNISIYSAYYRSLKDYLQPMILATVLLLPSGWWLEGNNLSALAIGIAYFVIYIIAAVASRKSGSFADKMGSVKTTLNISLILGLLAGLLAGALHSINLLFFSLPAIFFFVFVLVFENLRKPSGVALVSEMADRKVLATSLSIESQYKAALAAVMAPLTGLIADLAGVGAGLFFLSFFLLILYPFIRISK